MSILSWNTRRAFSAWCYRMQQRARNTRRAWRMVTGTWDDRDAMHIRWLAEEVDQ